MLSDFTDYLLSLGLVSIGNRWNRNIAIYTEHLGVFETNMFSISNYAILIIGQSERRLIAESEILSIVDLEIERKEVKKETINEKLGILGE